MTTTVIEGKKRLIVCDNPKADLPVYYANNSETQVSNLDVRFRLGQIQEVDEEAVHVKNIFTMYMSLEHARTFSTQLRELLERLDTLTPPNSSGA